MLANDPNMPNPLLIVFVFALSLALVRVFTTFIHEMGHALVGLLFLKGNFEVYIGSYGDPEKGKHFKIGRLRFHFIYDPFSIEKGVFISEQQETTHLKNFLITLGGPLASLITAFIYIYIAIYSPIPEVVKIAFYILTGSSFVDFWYNIKPSTTPIILHNQKIAYNDGYLLKYSWIQMFGKNIEKASEDNGDSLLDKED